MHIHWGNIFPSTIRSISLFDFQQLGLLVIVYSALNMKPFHEVRGYLLGSQRAQIVSSVRTIECLHFNGILCTPCFHVSSRSTDSSRFSFKENALTSSGKKLRLIPKSNGHSFANDITYMQTDRIKTNLVQLFLYDGFSTVHSETRVL